MLGASAIFVIVFVPELRKKLVPMDTWVGLASAVTVIALASRNTGIWPFFRRLLESRPLLFLGAISYSVYLVHQPLLVLFYRLAAPYLSARDSLLFIVLVGIPMSIAVAAVFYLFCERPFTIHPTRKSSSFSETFPILPLSTPAKE